MAEDFYGTVSVKVGWVNIAYLTTAAVLGLSNYSVFVALTSWVHYFKYIHQYYFRAAKGSMKRYKAWQRDVLLYKTIALMNLAYIYLKPIYLGEASLNYVSLAIIASGYFVSISATNALGIDGTYFGIELGFVKADYCFVKSFPYNTIPHPMIMGQVFGLCGVMLPAHVHGPWWWLIPVHIALYFTHMTQEIFDVWKGEPWFRNIQNKPSKD